jgi:hypothetical protein
MKPIMLLLASLCLVFSANGQDEDDDFGLLIHAILNNTLPDSISKLMPTKACELIIFQDETTTKYKSVTSKICILSEESIFLEDPEYYFDFERIRIGRRRASLTVAIMEHDPFKKSKIQLVTCRFIKRNGTWVKN